MNTFLKVLSILLMLGTIGLYIYGLKIHFFSEPAYMIAYFLYIMSIFFKDETLVGIFLAASASFFVSEHIQNIHMPEANIWFKYLFFCGVYLVELFTSKYIQKPLKKAWSAQELIES